MLDPPRAGIARSVLKSLIDSNIPKLTIISCNPATLARDLGILTGTLVENEKGGYSVDALLALSTMGEISDGAVALFPSELLA